MLTVEVCGNDLEGALKMLQRKLRNDGILQELIERSIGHKHSDFVKLKMRKANRLRLKRIKKMENRRGIV